jgi:hypothetical protein
VAHREVVSGSRQHMNHTGTTCQHAVMCTCDSASEYSTFYVTLRRTCFASVASCVGLQSDDGVPIFLYSWIYILWSTKGSIDRKREDRERTVQWETAHCTPTVQEADL